MSSMKSQNCANCFHVLSDATRVQIVKTLKAGDSNVSDITEAMGVTQPTVSYHLKLLDSIGMVEKHKQGREIIYAFNKNYPCKGCGVFSAPIKI